MRRRRGVGAIANYKAALRDIKRRRAKGLPVNPDYAAQVHAAASARPEPPARPWWADKEEDEPMTINGGQPHSVGYQGQPFKITVHDAEQGGRRTVAWTKAPEDKQLLRNLETRPGWTDAKYEHVRNRKTGE